MGASERIRDFLVPEFIAHQQEKAADYNGSLVPGMENADVLGVRGQYADIWRKIAKLKKALWDGEELTGEQPREILLDLIGHAFLTIDMLDRTEPKMVAAPAVICPRCGHQAFMHDEDGKPKGGCIGTGPGHACGCEYSCQYINTKFVPGEESPSDRELLRRLAGHGMDGCPACVKFIAVIELDKGSPFDWQEDIP